MMIFQQGCPVEVFFQVFRVFKSVFCWQILVGRLIRWRGWAGGCGGAMRGCLLCGRMARMGALGSGLTGLPWYTGQLLGVLRVARACVAAGEFSGWVVGLAGGLLSSLGLCLGMRWWGIGLGVILLVAVRGLLLKADLRLDLWGLGILVAGACLPDLGGRSLWGCWWLLCPLVPGGGLSDLLWCAGWGRGWRLWLGLISGGRLDGLIGCMGMRGVLLRLLPGC